MDSIRLWIRPALLVGCRLGVLYYSSSLLATVEPTQRVVGQS